MSQLSGIVSLFFIAAALLTSWYGGPARHSGEEPFPTLLMADE
jgi:hypothetical protein